MRRSLTQTKLSRRWQGGLLMALGLISLLLSACQSSSLAVNGLYSGGLYDDSVGYLGGFAIDVTTHGSTVSGAACFVAITGDAACNQLYGSFSGERFTFTVGSISFSATVQGQRISGRYSYEEGSGSFSLVRDESLRADLSSVGAHESVSQAALDFKAFLAP